MANGDISHYYVYAIPLRSTVSNNTLQTLQMVAIINVYSYEFHGHYNFNTFAYRRHFLAAQELAISH